MNAPPALDDPRVGALVAELLLESLRGLNLQTSSKHVIDTLPDRIRRHAFLALLQQAETAAPIRYRDDRQQQTEVALRCLTLGLHDVIPVYVTDTPDRACPNEGTVGFASCLRDYFADGAGRHRVLLTFTAGGNETQRSAQDLSADHSLITLPRLLSLIANRTGQDTEVNRAIAAVWLDYTREPWGVLLGRWTEFLCRAAAATDPYGSHLPVLGCFLPDTSPDPVAGSRIQLLEDREARQRARGASRLFDNAMIHERLAEAVGDPLLNQREFFDELFESAPNVADQLYREKRGALDSLDMQELQRLRQSAQKRQKNSFLDAIPQVEGAVFHRFCPRGDTGVLAIRASGAVTLRYRLEHPHVPRKEYAQVVYFDDGKARIETLKLSKDVTDVAFSLPALAPDAYRLYRLALSPGPKSLKSPIDERMVVVYGGDDPSVIIENGLLPSLETGAWSVRGTPAFTRYRPDSDDPDAVITEPLEHPNPVPAPDASEERLPSEVRFPDSAITLRILEESDEAEIEEGYDIEPVAALLAWTVREGDRIRPVFRRHAHHMDAIRSLQKDNRVWVVNFESLTRKVSTDAEKVSTADFELAVSHLLHAPRALRLRQDKTLTALSTPELPPAHRALLDGFLLAREALFAELLQIARPLLPRLARDPAAPIPLALLPLHRCRFAIDAYLLAWQQAVDGAWQEDSPFSTIHELLLQMDTLTVYTDRPDRAAQVVVLPTQPWMLKALLTFQDTLDQTFATWNNARKPPLLREEVEQLIPSTGLEDWYLSEGGWSRLLLVDSTPFHLVYDAAATRRARVSTDYISRVVSGKIARYLRMHPHLATAQRTLRLAFVHAGGGGIFLDGLRHWLRTTPDDRLRTVPLGMIPTLDITLYTGLPPEQRPPDHGGDFDRLFRAITQDDARQEDSVENALLSRTRYRKRDGYLPDQDRDAVHICFVHGLVTPAQQKDISIRFSDGWDGGFGEGLMPAPLRYSRLGPDGLQMETVHGLWIQGEEGMRGALKRLLALAHGCRYRTLRSDQGIFWSETLPTLESLASTYRHSDWVVHLDRELSLDLFTQNGKKDVHVIEYSDQEVPEIPGFDSITITSHLAPYKEQLSEILSFADLSVPDESARDAADELLDEINVLSGSWALDFLLGSIASERYRTRLKGNVGAALVYRWIRRIERQPNRPTDQEMIRVGHDGQLIVPLFISLEDLIRAAPANGLSRKGGLVERFSNEYDEDDKNKTHHTYCDDLLLLYLLPTAPGQPSQMFGRVIEVKFGSYASLAATQNKAVSQVQTTAKILRDFLPGPPGAVAVHLRHKRLSLLIKAQLEQAVAWGALPRDVFKTLNASALSRNLATGNYTLQYTTPWQGRQLDGDVFLLTRSGHPELQISVQDNVRVISLPERSVNWLAFSRADVETIVTAPPDTFPDYASLLPPVPAPTDPPIAPPVPPAPPAPTDPPITPPAPTDPADTIPSEIERIPSLTESVRQPIYTPPDKLPKIREVVQQLQSALNGHRIELQTPLTPEETDRGPRLLRAYARLRPGQQIASIRKISEDLAREVGTISQDVHICNVMERHAVGIDLPISGLEYSIPFEALLDHPSFYAARAELSLGFCVGIGVTGRPHWVDLAAMPHALIAGTTGSGKTIFLRVMLLTLAMSHPPERLQIALSSSKAMDFQMFSRLPHARTHRLATTPAEALALAQSLIAEMERRKQLITDAMYDNLLEYNQENPQGAIPLTVAVFDEFASMADAFDDRAARQSFESAIGRLAQEARAMGIHLVICMQRPDANIIRGSIKANIPHRFALRLPTHQDSQVILGEIGAETLLGQGDLLYKDDSSRLHRLQVPNLESTTIRRILKALVGNEPPEPPDPGAIRTCPRCGTSGTVQELFGLRKLRYRDRAGQEMLVERPQSWCKGCRARGSLTADRADAPPAPG